MDLIPKYLKLEKGQGFTSIDIKDTDNGKTLKDMGIKNRDYFSARRLECDELGEEIEHYPILDDD